MARESNQNVFLIQKDASSFAEFEISEFEISRVDCISDRGTGNRFCRSFTPLTSKYKAEPVDE